MRRKPEWLDASLILGIWAALVFSGHVSTGLIGWGSLAVLGLIAMLYERLMSEQW